MKKSIWLFALLTIANSAPGSMARDKAFALRTIVPVVLNLEQEPVFGEHIENELAKFLRTNSRFELPNEEYVAFKDLIRTFNFNDPKTPTEAKLEWIKPQILELNKKGVDAVLVAEVFQGNENYRLSLVLATTQSMEFIVAKIGTVGDSFAIESFTSTIKNLIADILEEIPFEGTVLRRDGYRVVLDRGYPDLREGMEISAYTLEEREGKPVLEETGLIQITQAGEMLSFGKITVEKKPLEVTTLNKFLLQVADSDRDLASTSTVAQFPGRELGFVDLQVGGSLVTITNAAADGSGLADGNHFYPGASLHGQMWLTGRIFADLDVGFGMATLNPPSSGTALALSSSVTDLRAQIGYRLGVADRTAGVGVNLRAGYGRHGVSVDPSTDPLTFMSTTYSGILVGGGAHFAVNEDYQIGFDVSTYLFPSAVETPLTSGSEITGVLAWDFSLRANYHYSDKMDIIAKLNFQSYSAEFAGVGTRPLSMVSSGQSSRALTLGVQYYF